MATTSKNKPADTKPAADDAPETPAADDAIEDTEGRRFFTTGELAGAIVIALGLMFFCYGVLGVAPKVGSDKGTFENICALALGFIVLLVIVLVVGWIVSHLLRLHHGALRDWLLGLGWSGLVLVGFCFTKTYEGLGTLLGPRWTAMVDKARDRWDNRRGDGDTRYGRLRAAILAAWCDHESDLIKLVRESPGLYLARLVDDVMQMVGRSTDDAEQALSTSYGEPVWVDGFKSPNGVWLRLPENEVPDDLAVDDRPEPPDPELPDAEHEDEMCQRIREAIWDAWCASTKPPVQVRPGRLRTPGHYFADIPPGILTVPRDRDKAPEFLIPAAAVLSKHFGEQITIPDAWHLAGGVRLALVIGTDPAGEGPAEPAEAPADADTSRNGVPVTTTADAPATGNRAGGRFGGRRVPPEGRSMIAWVDDFTPTDDTELHDLLLKMAAFQHDLGQAMHDLHERCTSPALHLDKRAMAATSEAADGITDSAAACANASAKYEQRYQNVSDEVAGGLDLPKEGSFTTGQGANG